MTDNMTQARAEAEMALVKRIIDRHVDEGWLIGYHHEAVGGFSYRFWRDHYEAKREREMEDAA